MTEVFKTVKLKGHKEAGMTEDSKSITYPMCMYKWLVEKELVDRKKINFLNGYKGQENCGLI